jgi:hypothetical protein
MVEGLVRSEEQGERTLFRQSGNIIRWPTLDQLLTFVLTGGQRNFL